MSIHDIRAAGRLIALLLACWLVLSACGSDDDSGEDAAAAAQGAWTVESGTVDGEEIPIVEGSPITMVIDGDEVSGVSACNNYQTSVTIDGDQIEFGPTAGTLMACEEEVMDSEQAFLAALAAVDTVAVDGDTMTLSGNNAEITLTRNA